MASAMADDVAVYRGTWRLAVDAEFSALIAPTVKAFLVVNYTTGQTSQVLYYTRNGKKLLVLDTLLDNMRATLPNGKLATVLATGTGDRTSATVFNYGGQFLRGTDSALLLETQPAKRFIQRPRSFAGQYFLAESDPGPDTGMQSATMVYSLDSAKTTAANNTDKTVDQVVTQITQALVAQGYPAPN